MGNVGYEITGILSDIGKVMQTVNFATQLLGGPGSGGLFGVDTPSSSDSTSRLMQYQNTQGNLGVTNATIYKNAATLTISGPQMLDRIVQYQSAWSTIAAATNAASASVISLQNSCEAQASAAQTALTTQINPVLAQIATVSATIADTTSFVQKVQNELKSGADTAGSAYVADIQKLQTMSPTGQEVANAEQDAQTFGSATANPGGSLIVSGSSLVDRMNLISTNARALESNCNGQLSGPEFFGSE